MQFQTFQTFSGYHQDQYIFNPQITNNLDHYMKGPTQQSISQQFLSNQKKISLSNLYQRNNNNNLKQKNTKGFIYEQNQSQNQQKQQQASLDDNLNSSYQKNSHEENQNSLLDQSDDGYLNFKLKLNHQSQNQNQNIKSKQLKKKNSKKEFHTPMFQLDLQKKTSNQVLIDKKKITVSLLPQQIIKQSLVIINKTSQKIGIKIDCSFPIDIINQSKYKHYAQEKQKSGKIMFELSAWESYELSIQLGGNFKKDYYDEDQTFVEGDIFETMTIQYKLKNAEDIKANYKKIYLPINVHYIMPKLKLDFNGITELATICTSSNKIQKIIKIKIQQNSFLQYPLSLTLSLSKFYESGLYQATKDQNYEYTYINKKEDNCNKEGKSNKVNKIECNLKTYGNIKVFPDKLTMYDNQPYKVMIRKNKLQKNNKEKGVLTLQSQGSNLIFIIGISFI